MVLDYYLIELINYLRTKNYGIKEIRLFKPVRKSFRRIIKRELKLKIVNKASIKQDFKFYLRYRIGPLKSILRIVKISINYCS